jgi:hypothetical protein
MTDTIELTSPVEVTGLTATLRPSKGLPQGTFRLRRDRCVVEISVRVLGRPLLRGRIKTGKGTLTVGELSTLELELLPGSLPFTRRRLARGLGPEPLALRSRTVHTDDDAVVLTAVGPLPTRWLHVELAAEFTR